MILKSKETTIAYRCPICGQNVISVVGVFMLSGDLIKLKCSCGESELTITYTSDKKIRINVPCILCPKPHNYVIGSNIFFYKDIFNLSCSFSSIDICFIGKKENVIKELSISEKELLDMLKEAGIDDFDKLHEQNDDFPIDSQILDIVMFVIDDLKEEGKINCPCEKGNYKVSVEDDSVFVYCANCGASVSIPVDSSIGANAFLHCDKLILK